MQADISIAPAVGLLLTAGFAVAWQLPSADPESVGISAERLDRVGTVFEQETDKGALPAQTITDSAEVGHLMQ